MLVNKSVKHADTGRCFVLDIDECDTNPCDHLCTNTVGNYSCSCYDGYQLTNDKCIAQGQLLGNGYSIGVYAILP